MAQEIVLDIKPKKNKLKVYAPPVIIAVLLASVLFLIGFAVGKYTEFELPLTSKETATKSATRKGWFVYETKNFSLEYPKSWKVKKNSADEPIGAKVETDGGRVQFWFTKERVYRFSAGQKKTHKSKTKSNLKVDGRTAAVIEYLHKDGDYFIVIEAPASKEKPEVTFWVVAANTEYKDFLMEIASTFLSKSVVEEK